MKKIVLSTVALATMATMANASAETELAALKKQMAAMMAKIEKLEAKQAKSDKKVEQVVAKASSNGVMVKEHKVPVLEFEGKHYLGFVSDSEKDVQKFETRRNYFQVKGYFNDNPKDYMRLTLDTFQETKDTTGSDYGSWLVRVKYAFLYLDNVLPYTGVEIGQAHRPWIDYEEHGGWNYRSISKVLVEDSNAAHFTNSADLGVNFKTKTANFSSELGIFNGEGYHADDSKNTDLSAEWRLTAHLLGTGKEKRKKSLTYADISFFGQYNSNYKETTTSGAKPNFVWYGLHAVYNQPEFLLAAQYVKATDGGQDKEGKGWSVNGEYRFTDDWNLIGRYDNYKYDVVNTSGNQEMKRTIAGIAYQYNKNVEFIANWLKEEQDGVKSTDAIMFTAEVNW